MDYFDPIFPPQVGTDARVYLIYLTADGSGSRIYHGRDTDIDMQINFAARGPDGQIVGYGSPIFTTDFFTQQFSTDYPGPGGEAYREIDTVRQRDLLQESPSSLYVDQNGDIQRKTKFPDANKLTVVADNVDEVVISGLPGGTIAQMTGLNDASVQQVVVDDGTFELSSPIKGALRLRLSHPGYIQRDYQIGFV